MLVTPRHLAAIGSESVNLNAVVLLPMKLGRIVRPRQHMDLMPELYQGTGLVPRICADPSETGLWRIFEGQESNLHHRFLGPLGCMFRRCSLAFCAIYRCAVAC